MHALTTEFFYLHTMFSYICKIPNQVTQRRGRKKNKVHISIFSNSFYCLSTVWKHYWIKEWMILSCKNSYVDSLSLICSLWLVSVQRAGNCSLKILVLLINFVMHNFSYILSSIFNNLQLENLQVNLVCHCAKSTTSEKDNNVFSKIVFNSFNNYMPGNLLSSWKIFVISTNSCPCGVAKTD